MRFLFAFSALCCSVMGLLVWFFPETLIRINDWLTEKTLLHESSGVLMRVTIGGIFVGIAAIFWWVLLS